MILQLGPTKTVNYCGVVGGGHWGRQNPTKIMAPPSPPLSVIKIV